MKNVIAYIRVSTDGQVGEDKFGLDSQRNTIAEYCEAHDMNIVKWVADEGESGAKYRKKFDDLVYGDEAQNPPYEAVVVAKSDRVARDVYIYFSYKAGLMRKGIELVSVAEDFGTFGVLAPILESFTVCMAQMEREAIKGRTSGGRRIKANAGGYAGGHAPYGYTAVGGSLVVDQEAAEVVKKLFELRNSGMTQKKIAAVLNEAGMLKNGKEWGQSSVGYILANERTYRGEYRYGKGGEWVKGQHEAILRDGE